MHTRTLTILLGGLLTVGVGIAVVSAVATGDEPVKNPANDKVESKWLAKLEVRDRALLDENLGYAPAAIADDVIWPAESLPAGERNFDSLRGKVVLIQSWTSGSRVGSSWPARVSEALADFAQTDVRILALHTPENAANAVSYLEKNPQPVPVAIDPSGRFCDSLGIYKQPVNILVDRQGVVRYVGLRLESLKAAVTKLVEEPFDPQTKPRTRPATSTPTTPTNYPPIQGSLSYAKDIRGKSAPTFHVEQWLTDAVDLQGKVVIIDFWATWCGPCVAAIPHMNELQEAFQDEVVAIGISDESADRFTKGMETLARRGVTAKSFKYAVALDPAGKMKNAIQIQGIPHVIVMSSDWIVRWQGHPSGLTRDILGQIVAASNSASGSSFAKARNRWQRG